MVLLSENIVVYVCVFDVWQWLEKAVEFKVNCGELYSVSKKYPNFLVKNKLIKQKCDLKHDQDLVTLVGITEGLTCHVLCIIIDIS